MSALINPKMIKSVTHDNVPWIGTGGVTFSIWLSENQQALAGLVAGLTALYVTAKLVAFLVKWWKDKKPPVAD